MDDITTGVDAGIDQTGMNNAQGATGDNGGNGGGTGATAEEIAAATVAALLASGAIGKFLFGPFGWIAEAEPGTVSPQSSGSIVLGVGDAGTIRGRLMDGTRAIPLGVGDSLTMTTSFNGTLISDRIACTTVAGTNIFDYVLQEGDTANDVSPNSIKMTARVTFADGSIVSFLGPALIVQSP